MSAARIVTTTEKFDEMGKLVERIIKEEFPEECKCKCGEKNQGKAFFTENMTWKDFFENAMLLYQEMR